MKAYPFSLYHQQAWLGGFNLAWRIQRAEASFFSWSYIFQVLSPLETFSHQTITLSTWSPITITKIIYMVDTTPRKQKQSPPSLSRPKPRNVL